MTEIYDVFLKGHGHYKVNASICRVPMTSDDLECEVEVIDVKKFDDFLEEYAPCELTEDEMILIEREVAIKFFNNLH